MYCGESVEGAQGRVLDPQTYLYHYIYPSLQKRPGSVNMIGEKQQAEDTCCPHWGSKLLTVAASYSQLLMPVGLLF